MQKLFAKDLVCFLIQKKGYTFLGLLSRAVPVKQNLKSSVKLMTRNKA